MQSFPSSNAHVVLPHFGCVPTYFGSSAAKTSVFAATCCRILFSLLGCGKVKQLLLVILGVFLDAMEKLGVQFEP